jgi:hypothetical protein
MGNYSCHALLTSTLCVHELDEWPASCHGYMGSRPDMVAGEERIYEALVFFCGVGLKPP